MIEYIVAVGILIVSYLIFKLYIKPRKQIAKYVELFRKEGYRVG